jgi:gamma-glutamyltranspeptidase/glutathione hydrolase
VLALTGGLLLGGSLLKGKGDPSATAPSTGRVVGQPQGARAGAEVLAAGGNAVDAVVAAALVAAVTDIQQCGIGGYGGHMTLAVEAGRRVVSIDFNSAAPRAARPDMFLLDARGQVKGAVNLHGWLAAGVPGTLAGLQLALDRFGTQPFARLVQPALRYARDGFEVGPSLAAAVRNGRAQLAKDPEASRLLLPGGEPLRPGSRFRNPALADLLQTLAERGSVESFYRGDVARRIAESFRANGGLVTEADLADYRARVLEPLSLSWCGCTVRTAPLTAGGATVLEALAVLRALGWESLPPDDPHTTRARLEALRLAWDDRLRLLGDPEQADVPLDRLLSPKYAQRLAERVRAALREGRPVAATGDGRSAAGTVHLSAADGQGNLAALTLTHGEGFGARVAAAGLGLFLGHGMSRFDPRPGHPNAPGPGKRPLHNMCPTVVLRGGRAVAAVGAVGGRKIPNAVFDVLARLVGRGASLEEAVAAPRLHTDGRLTVVADAGWPPRDLDHLRQAGYTIQKGAAAVVHAAAFDPHSGAVRTASR